MKKTILFLMNGFGIEQVDSYNVYNEKLMPNLDKYTKEYLFSAIESKATSLASGYRLFSTGSKKPLTYSLINNYLGKFDKIPNMNYYIDNTKDSKIQIYLLVDDEECLEHLRELINFIRIKKTNPIFVHLVLTSANIDDYPDLEKIITKINYDFKECKIATIIGLNALKQQNLNPYLNMLKNQIGERWIEISKKFNSLINLKIPPINAKEIYINEGFNITDNDTLFFLNYEYTDLTNFVNSLNNVFYSMFPINGIKYTMLAYPKSGIYMDKTLEKINSQALILTTSNNMPITNYYCNGLQNMMPKNLSFAKLEDNFNNIKDVIKKSDFDLIIIDYQIDNIKSISELNGKLSFLDRMLAFVHDYCISEKYSLFISSLYGMKKELLLDSRVKTWVNFSSKVPFIVVDERFNKNNFTISYGDVYNLAHTIYTNINNSYSDGEVLIRRKSQISKMLKK